MLVDLNSGSGFAYGAPAAVCDAGLRINALIDAALETEHRSKPPRDYLGGSRIGEPCARRLAYEVTLTPVDEGKELDGSRFRIFDAGHELEDLTIRWLRAAGFDLRTLHRLLEAIDRSLDQVIDLLGAEIEEVLHQAELGQSLAPRPPRSQRCAPCCSMTCSATSRSLARLSRRTRWHSCCCRSCGR